MPKQTNSKTKKKKAKPKPKQKIKEEIDEVFDLIEGEGTLKTIDELRGFEQKQFDYITSKISTAILNRIGRQNFDRAVKQLKSNQITLKQAAKNLNLKMGDLLLVLEHENALPEADLERKLKKDRNL